MYRLHPQEEQLGISIYLKDMKLPGRYFKPKEKSIKISQNLYSIFISNGTYEKDEACFENKETLITLLSLNV